MLACGATGLQPCLQIRMSRPAGPSATAGVCQDALEGAQKHWNITIWCCDISALGATILRQCSRRPRPLFIIQQCEAPRRNAPRRARRPLALASVLAKMCTDALQHSRHAATPIIRPAPRPPSRGHEDRAEDRIKVQRPHEQSYDPLRRLRTERRPGRHTDGVPPLSRQRAARYTPERGSANHATNATRLLRKACMRRAGVAVVLHARAAAAAEFRDSGEACGVSCRRAASPPRKRRAMSARRRSGLPLSGARATACFVSAWRAGFRVCPHPRVNERPRRASITPNTQRTPTHSALRAGAPRRMRYKAGPMAAFSDDASS